MIVMTINLHYISSIPELFSIEWTLYVAICSSTSQKRMKNTDHDIRITPYKSTRFWAIWRGGELLAVVCYKKGALAIKAALVNSRCGACGYCK